MDKATIEALPVEMRKYVTPLRREYDAVQAAQAAAAHTTSRLPGFRQPRVAASVDGN